MKASIETEILKAIKSKRGSSLFDLRIAIPSEYLLTDDPDSLLLKHIRKLTKWGLIEAFHENGNLLEVDEISSLRGESYFFSPLAAEMESILGINFAGTTQAIFGDPLASSRYPQLFMLMPFSKKLRPVFDNHVKKVAKEVYLSVGRADDFFSTGSIINDIWSAIFNATIIVADCTDRNPNVFYEIGIAHTLGKNTILISQSIDDVPFDLRHLRVIIYRFTPKGLAEFEENFRKMLLEIRNSK